MSYDLRDVYRIAILDNVDPAMSLWIWQALLTASPICYEGIN